jgi:hypothetical protein
VVEIDGSGPSVWNGGPASAMSGEIIDTAKTKR